jgi:EmrB/QacA subfamily drug resistance transporter
MMPATLSILNIVFEKENKGMALGIWAAVAGAAAALGPIIGGALIDAYSWRLIFLINLPVGIAAFLAALFIVKESVDSTVSRRIDIPGAVFATTSLLCLTYALVEGQKYGWTSSLIISLFVASFICAVVFIFIELRQPQPLVQLQLFRNVTFSAGYSVGLILMCGLMSVLFLLVLFLQLVLGFSAIKTGLAILPMPLVIIIVGPLSGRLSDRIGSRWMMFSGMLLTALGIYLMSHLSLNTSQTDLILPLAVCGLGMGLSMPPMTSAVITNAPQEKSGVASGVLTTARNIGAVLGISTIGAVLQNQLVKNFQVALNQIPQLPPFIRDIILAKVSSGDLRMGATIPSISGSLGDQLQLLFQEQFVHSLNTAMTVSVFVCLAGAVVALFVHSHVSARKPTHLV